MSRKKAAKEKFDVDDENKKKSIQNEKVAAKDMRKRALERVGETTKRKGKEEGTESAPTKRKS